MVDVKQDLAQLLIENFGVDVSEIKDDTTLAGDMGLDSIELVQLAQDVEAAFDVELADDMVTGTTTVAELASTIQQQTGASK